MYLAELPWRRGCSVIRCASRGLFSFLSVFFNILIKLHLASLPLASSYSRVAVSSIFCAQNIFFSAQTRGAPLRDQDYRNMIIEEMESIVVITVKGIPTTS